MFDRKKAIFRMVRPESVAIIGASSDFRKVNGRPLKHLLEKGYKGRIYPVNPKYEEIAGLACYPGIRELPEVVDVAIIAVPAGLVLDVVEQLGEKGIHAAVVFSSGFGELGEQGRAMENLLQQRARALDVVLLGPNCLGFINAFENVYATFSQYADSADTRGGPVAFVTQSGAFGTAIAALANQRSLGLGYFINTGNQIDASFSELMSTAIEDERVRVAAGYLEGVRDGSELVALATRAHELGKPLVLTKVGRKESGVRAAASHTGALAVQDDVFNDILKQYGVLRARNEEKMLDMIEAFAYIDRCSGNGLGIVTQSGGAGVMMADRAEEVGLAVPELTAATKARLRSVMPEFGAADNPVDVTGQFVAEPQLLRDSVLSVMQDPGIDVTIVWLQLMHGFADVLVEVFLDIKRQSEKPFIVCWVAAPQAAVKHLREHGIAVFHAGERAVEAVSALARFHADNARMRKTLAAPASGQAAVITQFEDGAQATVKTTEVLVQAGVPMAAVSLATTADEAVQAWKRFGSPAVALKIESPDILHKTDIGGVLLGLNDESAVNEGFSIIMERATKEKPDASVSGVIVQPMSSGDTELVIGLKRDDAFGIVVMVGLGGIMVEVLRDVAFRLAPFSADEGLRMLNQLNASPVLDGVRGRPAADRQQLATLLSNISIWAAAHEDAIEELDLNPVLVGPDGASVVDCLLVVNNRRGTDY